MRIPGRKLAVQWWRQARSRWARGVLVLGYHRVADGVDPWGISVSPGNFAGQMQVLARVGRPMRLEDAMRCLAKDAAPRRAVVVTFDDGYADNLHHALPALEAANVPATVFVTTGSPGREFWWDHLAELVSGAESVQALNQAWEAAGCGVLPAPRGSYTSGRRTAFLAAAGAQARALPAAARDRCLERFRSRLDGIGPTAVVHRALRTSELQELASHDLIDIGSHTVTHPSLGDLDPDAQWAELRDSRAALVGLTGLEITALSYPNGSFSSETVRMARDAGFTCACSSVPDLATRRSDPFALPRLWVDDWPAETFARWIERWIHG